MRYLIYIFALIAAAAGLIWLVLNTTGATEISFNTLSLEMKTSTLLIVLIIGFIVLYVLVGLLRYVFSLRSRISKINKKRLSAKAGKELIQGFLLLSEGHWSRAEKLLVKNAKHCETPVINYLAAARAAHLQDKYERRDELLKTAVELDTKADIVVSVSQAEMQMDSKQIEQAQATLLRLQDLSPSHPYISKLLAKVYFKQENWSALFELMPLLLKQKALKDADITKFKTAAIKGLFEEYAAEGKADEIQKAWKKLPSKIRKLSDAVLIYANSLNTAGESSLASDALVSQINEQWDERLVELYGQLNHKDAISAGEKAKKWLVSHNENPSLLLTLARLNVQKKLWGKAKSFYENSLNMRPNAIAYLELAELLQKIGEQENADNCYRIGLQYCITKKAERLSLKSEPKVNKAKTNHSIDEEEEFYTV